MDTSLKPDPSCPAPSTNWTTHSKYSTPWPTTCHWRYKCCKRKSPCRLLACCGKLRFRTAKSDLEEVYNDLAGNAEEGLQKQTPSYLPGRQVHARPPTTGTEHLPKSIEETHARWREHYNTMLNHPQLRPAHTLLHRLQAHPLPQTSHPTLPQWLKYVLLSGS